MRDNQKKQKKLNDNIEEKNIILEKVKMKDKNKKVVLCVILVLLILIILYIISTILPKKDYVHENNKESNISVNNISQYDIKLECSLVNENGEKISGKGYIDNNFSIYGSGDNVLCELENMYKKSFDKISFEFENEIIKLQDVYSNNSNVNINISDKNNKSTINITTTEEEINLGDIKLKFNINDKPTNNDRYIIMLSNLRLITSPTSEDYLDFLSLELKYDSKRVVWDNGKLKFQYIGNSGNFEVVNEYACKSQYKYDCTVNVASQMFAYNNEDSNIVMITDGNYNILFDKTKGIIDTYGDKPQWLHLEGGIGKYIYINKKDSNKYGIIDKNGNVIKEFNLNEWPYTVYMRFSLRYSIENDMLVDIKNDKYGIIKLTSDDIIVDYIYEDLDLINSKIFKAKNDNSWYVYDIKTQQKYIEEGFDYIHYASDEILIVEKDNMLHLKNYNNKKIIDDTIKITKEDVIQAYVDYSNNNIISIHICKDEYCHDYKERYEYNIADNKLSKVN